MMLLLAGNIGDDSKPGSRQPPRPAVLRLTLSVVGGGPNAHTLPSVVLHFQLIPVGECLIDYTPPIAPINVDFKLL